MKKAPHSSLFIVLLAAVLFALTPAGHASSVRPRILGFSPLGGEPETTVAIRGQGFQDVVAVTFNGFPARFIIQSQGQISAIVPPQARSGFIRVITSGGTAILTSL